MQKYTKQNQREKKKEGELANNYSICRGNQLFCLLKYFFLSSENKKALLYL